MVLIDEKQNNSNQNSLKYEAILIFSLKKRNMKNFIFILSILNSFLTYSQQNTYLVTYKMSVYGSSDTNTRPHQDHKINEVMNKTASAREYVEFELYFNKYSSSFRLKEKLIPEEEELFYKLAVLPGAQRGDTYHKNIKIKIKIKETELSGDVFKINFPFEQYKWEITNETKIINGFKCYKASSHWEEYDYTRNKTLTFDPTVWFTNDIPFPFGPKGLDGLPGLVLEGTLNGKTYFYVSEIKKDIKNGAKYLEEPKKGKSITPDEFLKLSSASVKARQNK